MSLYIKVFLIGLIITYISTPLIRRFAIKLEAVDKPDKRRVNKRPVPNLGGIAIYLGFTAAVLFGSEPAADRTGIIFGGSLIMLIGVIDDIYELRPSVKLFGQLLAAVVLVLSGISIEFISNPFADSMIYLGVFAIPVTIIWIVGVTNTVNLIDGLDGLAAGVSIIAAATLFIVSLQEGQFITAVLTAALAGSALGFLRFNFYPARIFMGDGGAMMIGFILASVSIIGALKSAAAMTLFVPVLALGIPIFDTAFAIIRRVYYKKPIARADHGHLHHRLLALGWNHKQSVLIVYIMSTVLGAVAIVVNGLNFQNGMLLIIMSFIFLLYSCYRLGIFTVDLPKEGRSLHQE
ncbi:undecaprenyl/decaprenyl-phosphate alpha-N-acetylglucosaminyl 1-phosphate transferase [Halanaerobiaceae bacterium Z-7014]|uniref:Undecaprenyl/decaprenyl-phosphate alpha-N-acetylglucosaminyl 1-phosphate transferase n=1 Tax=Halonatronomonas betaini TaxID=2778430 RepID=A0A931AS00_9FIRM|nr:MraY family glycosyltransferase [Halonatronomonas betaini]MBF8437402.1 undecaprenyl/decaprenyl-phosphate alpha-N-acetylglucosaminyl 1-phosphate transferase [Halonatronomonas betaini]